jgi:hypothetical protein
MKGNQKQIQTKYHKVNLSILFTFLIIILLSSCGVVSGIFKAGMDFGIFIVIAILIVIVYVIMRMRRNKD